MIDPRDALLGVKYNLWQNDNQSSGVAIKTDIYLPVSTAGSGWVKIDTCGNTSILGSYSIKNVELSGEIGGHFRPAVNTEKDCFGNEFSTTFLFVGICGLNTLLSVVSL